MYLDCRYVVNQEAKYTTGTTGLVTQVMIIYLFVHKYLNSSILSVLTVIEFHALICLKLVLVHWPLIYLYLILKNLYFTKLIFELDFLFISNLIFTVCVACKNQVQNRQKMKFKNQVQKSFLWNRDFFKIKYR